ncbi:MAG: LPS-assembly protein LptD [Bryobacteraceae bacterium]
MAPENIKANLPSRSEIEFRALHQKSQRPWYYLSGSAEIITSDFELSADKIRYNADTHWAYATGHLHLEHFITGDKLNADRGKYNIETQTGTFYGVSGTSPAKSISSPGILTTANPFYFQAKWAQRIKNRYILHDGFMTDCKLPKPWWIFQAPLFDIVPGQRAIARNTVFRLKGIPIFYLPYFYRPLGKKTRHSGFLTPNIGHSTQFGWMVGAGYYWAISPSYDMTAVGRYFTLRGPALTYNFRGKPTKNSDFAALFYGVDDLYGAPLKKGQAPPRLKEGGEEFDITGHTKLLGFTGTLDWNYLSSYLFRQIFSYDFTGEIGSQVNSVGYLQRHYDDDTYSLSLAAERSQTFQAVTLQGQKPNQVIISKLPSVTFTGREHEIVHGSVPVWFSFGASAGSLARDEPTGTIPDSGGFSPQYTFQTGAIGRVDMEPRVTTEFNFKGISLMPSITLGATDYSNSYSANTTTYDPSACGPHFIYYDCPTTTAHLGNGNLFRKDSDFTLDLNLPPLERVFTPPKWLHIGPKVKHVIEAGANYEYVTGINQFDRIVHFDETDILSNTNQVTVWLTNRLYRKDSKGHVSEFLDWRVAQSRYFDPTFGGAVSLNGQPQRVVVLATEEISPYAFLDGPRNYSPVISDLTLSPFSFFNASWETEYDPVRHKFIDQTLRAGFRHRNYFASVGESAISTDPLLVPRSNQMTIGGGYGSSNRVGWNVTALYDYDLVSNRRLFDFYQASYNTNCCGFSFQIRQINLGLRNENQYLFSLSIANIGNFGSLQKQARIF